MKKFIYFILSIILLLSTIAFMPACDKENTNKTGDGFELVSEVNLITNGESITKSSKDYGDSFKRIRTITKNEFLQKEREEQTAKNNHETIEFTTTYQVYNPQVKTLSRVSESFLKKAKTVVSSTNVCYSTESNDTTIYYIAFATQIKYIYDKNTKSFILDRDNITDFAECKKKGSYYEFVLVKIIDNQTLKVADKEGITTYTVSSYKITYFK